MPYQAQQTMKPLIPRSDYGSPEAHRRDMETLQRTSWQLVGLRSRVRDSGDYLATEVLGIPVLIRNFDGELRAFRNVCAHRHCLLHDPGSGNSPVLKCRYHGWNYGVDGRTRKLPNAKQFPGFERDLHRLERFELAMCGELLFVRLRSDRIVQADGESPEALRKASISSCWTEGRSLKDTFGNCFDDLVSATNPQQWRLNLQTSLRFEADWKIPVEGSLESYHLEEVHAATFGQDPGEENSTHRLGDEFTEFSTFFRTDGFLERWEERSIRFMTGEFVGQYRHLHLFPNVMASLNDSLDRKSVV